jgi:hypothetical protein
MIRLDSPTLHGPVVPVIGPDVLNFCVLQNDATGDAFNRSRAAQFATERRFDRLRDIIHYFGAAIIFMAVIFGPAVVWLLVS